MRQTAGMADALERITNLVALLLERRHPLTLERIAFELDGFYEGSEVAVRGAFERDKALLRDLGVPIESEVLSGADAGRTGYRIDRRRYELADLQLTDDERHALQTAVAAARLDHGAFGLLKLGAAAHGSTDVVANVPDLPALPSLRDAVATRSEVTFGYRGRARTLHPYVLLLRDGFWYVIGFDPAAGETRTYRVDRIEGAVGIGSSGVFERPDDFDPRRAFPSDPKAIGDGGDAEEAEASVRVDALRAARVERELGADAVTERGDDGSIVVTVPCRNVAAFRSWLFGLGVHAEVLAPPTVREGVVSWLRAMAGTSGGGR